MSTDSFSLGTAWVSRFSIHRAALIYKKEEFPVFAVVVAAVFTRRIELVIFHFFLVIYSFIFGFVGSSLQCTGFSLRWLLLLQSMGSRCAVFSSCGTWAQ